MDGIGAGDNGAAASGYAYGNSGPASAGGRRRLGRYLLGAAP